MLLFAVMTYELATLPARLTPRHLRIFSSISSGGGEVRRQLVLYSKPGCCLCDGLKEKLSVAFSVDGPHSLHLVDLQARALHAPFPLSSHFKFLILYRLIVANNQLEAKSIETGDLFSVDGCQLSLDEIKEEPSFSFCSNPREIKVDFYDSEAWSPFVLGTNNIRVVMSMEKHKSLSFAWGCGLRLISGATMVKGRQGQRVRLYVRGTILGYKR
ncbi:hypothetical protein FCM35_KLT21595 [Carex littledalei]|uniref:Glutaredoxin-like protein n=1 Tax=Carex littledalei TaxID=544730 RepID=A0A833VDJ9_9POAL|nr:hypothetical protein FCM35_KLT21595 [Carex littledalei]